MYVHNINCNSKKVFIAIFHLPQKKNIITRFCSAMYILFTILEIKKKKIQCRFEFASKIVYFYVDRYGYIWDRVWNNFFLSLSFGYFSFLLDM